MGDIIPLLVSVLSLIVAVLALRVSRRQLEADKKSLGLQEQTFRFGRDLQRGKLVTDGSIRANFLQVTFMGPHDHKNEVMADLLEQSAVEALITLENTSNRDMVVENLGVIPRLLPGKSIQHWPTKSHFGRYLLGLRPVEGSVSISLRDSRITGWHGSTIEGWRELEEELGSSQPPVWNAAIYDTRTEEQVLFTKPIVMPHNGRKRIWRIEFGIAPEFYERLLLERRIFLSGITLFFHTDLGILEASFDYDLARIGEDTL